ncbi:hypothetical protein BGX21_000041 [Mortierella sp. AD011]|nr:hypothetical protein BGX21_000041 [Mortierella sp. AD011]
MNVSKYKQQRPTRWLTKALLSVTILATSAQAACISLVGSKACPLYSSFFVDTSVAKTVSAYNIAMPAFTTLSEFDSAVFNSTGFFTSSECTGYNSSIHIPYQDTVLCTIVTQDDASNKCKGQPTNITSNMCDSSCKLYQQGLTSMISTYCPKVSDALSGLQDLTTICSRKDTNSWAGLQDNTSTCIDALKNEATFCGLGSLADKCTFCKTNSTATCCSDAAKNCPTSTTVSSASTTVTSTKASSSASSTAGAGNTDSSDSGGIPSETKSAIIGGTVGGVILLAIFLFLCVGKIRRSNETQKGSNLTHKPSNASARYNISNPKLQEEGFIAAAATPIPMTTLPPIPTEPSSFGLSAVAASAGAAAAAGQAAPAKLSYCQALYPYQASMADELDLTPGDIVNVQRVFDDGWAVGVNMNTSKEGAFPVVCVMFVDESALDDDDFDDVNMHSMPPMTLREEDQEGRRSPSGRNSPRSSLPSRSSSPVHLPRRNSSIRDSTVIVPGTNPMTSSPLAGNNNNGGTGRMTPPVVRDTMMSDASSINRWWNGEK